MPPPNPAPAKLIIPPYAPQNSFICSWVVTGSVTVIVIFATLRIFPLVGTEKLKLEILRNSDGKVEPVDIFTKIGIVYSPISASLEALIMNVVGPIFGDDDSESSPPPLLPSSS